MKIHFNLPRAIYALASTAILFASCQKSDLASNQVEEVSSTIAVAATSAASTTAATDSVYLLQHCGRGGRRDSISQSALPTSIGSYLSANYAGFSFHKAFAIKNSSAAVTGFVVVIFYNNKPVGLLFDAAGAFVKVLEQREKNDLHGAGHHKGGRFEHRDGKQRDTIALAGLPASITTYFAANYASDTLVKAFRNRDSTIFIISQNNGVFVTIFSAAGGFVNREQLPVKAGRCNAIDLSALPAVAANYLAATYPNYVFKKAFSISQSGAIKAYVVIIDANNTKYAIEFDATGNFVKAKTIL